MTSIFQYFVIICFAIITLSLVRYNLLEYYNKRKNIHITRSINTANLGARIFSHAVKNQFVSIMAEVETLEQINGNAESMYHLKKIYEISEETLLRINDLHKRFNNIQLDFKPLPLNQVVFEALNKLGPLPKHITLYHNIEANSPICFVDLSHMTEVLINLLHNAIESLIGQEKGTLNISIKSEDPWCLLTVEDNGCGIDSEDIKNIYQPFFSTKSSSRNWGVGLSYCHQIVTAHDGKILVETKKHKGSTFKIFLPKIIRSE
jgi:signal transduction histidine kinase